MSRDAIVALRADREEMLTLAGSLTAEEWAMESACEGWSVQDVFAHLASYHHLTPASIKAGRRSMKDGFERINDALVEVRRGMSPAEQLDELEVWSARGISLLSALQRFPVSKIPAPMLDLGTHSLGDIANALAFDTYTHLRFDVLAPRGPVEREPLPADPLRLRPIMYWMLRTFGPLHRRSLVFLDAPVHLALHGPGGGDWTIEHDPADPKRPVTIRPGLRSAAAATIVSTTPEFVGWSTGRIPWRDADVETGGDDELAARVLDAILIF